MASQAGTPPSAVAGFLPEDMIQGGLADDFNGVVRQARWVIWDYDKAQVEALFVRLTIERTDLPPDADPEDRILVQHWSAGSTEFFRPGMTVEEGETSGKEGIYPKRVGTRTGLTNSTNWAQLLRSMIDAQVPRNAIKLEITWIEGMKAHWNRLPKDKKGGQFKDQGPDAKAKDVLCVTRFDGFVTGEGKTNGRPGVPTPAATTTSTATSAGAGGSLDEQIVSVIVAALTPNTPVKKTALSGIVMKAIKGKDAPKAVKRCVESSFLSGETMIERNILFDAEEGTVTLIGE